MSVFIPDSEQFPTDAFALPHHYRDEFRSVLIPHGMLQDRIEKMACDVRSEYGDVELHVVCVLKGSRGFFAALLKYLNNIACYAGASQLVREGITPPSVATYPPFLEHYVRILPRSESEGAAVAVGEVKTTAQQLTLKSEDLRCLEGKHVLVCEDMVNTGQTMTKLCQHLQSFSPKSLKVAALLEKRSARSCGFKADYVGFSVPDQFIVGFCLDYNECYRDLDHIAVLSEAGLRRHGRDNHEEEERRKKAAKLRVGGSAV